ncbi:hypothetical protein Dimus_025124 [Dionaea muscipula]
MIKFFLNSLVNSTKTSFQHLRNLKGSKPRREFKEVENGLEPRSSFAAMKISNQLEQVFKFIDANGNGKISPIELSDLLLCLGHDKSRVAEEAERMVREVDSDGDGYIDLNDYMKVVMLNDVEASRPSNHGSGNGHLAHHHHHYHHHHHHHHHHHGFEDLLMDVFLVFDSDNNGLISAKELSHVLNRLGFDHCGLDECNLMIKAVDMDGDGFVDFEEFKLMMMGSYDHDDNHDHGFGTQDQKPAAN